MTQITSHRFYASRKPHSELSGVFITPLIEVFITPDKITVIEKGLMRKEVGDEALVEVELRKYQYHLRGNSKGDKYLTLEVESEGRMVDESYKMLKLFDDYNTSSPIVNLMQANKLVTPEEPELFYNLIEETIREWFDYPLDADINLSRLEILFPSLRGRKKEPYLGIVVLLGLLEAFPEIVTELRENSDWNSFLRAVCPKGMIDTAEDLAKLTSDPWYLYLAILNLSVPLNRIDSSMVNAFIETFGDDVADTKCVKFMLDNLSDSDRVASTEILFDIASRYVRLKEDLTARMKAEQGDYYDEDEAYSPIHFSLGGSRFGAETLSFNVVPKAFRPVLAKSLFARIANGIESQISEAENSADCDEVDIKSELCDVLFEFLVELAEPALRSDLMEQDVIDRIEECFGSKPLNENGPLEYIEGRWGLIWPVKNIRSSFILSLENSVNNSVKNSRSPLVAAVCDNHAYFDKEGNFAVCNNRYYSTNDLMRLIEASVKKIDKILATLGRDITPENRGAYLMFNHRERNRAKTWYYYDLGVTEPRKIIALKMAKIKDELSITKYSQLSDKVFEEEMNALGEQIIKKASFLAGITLDNKDTLRYYAHPQSGKSYVVFDDDFDFVDDDFDYDFDEDDDNDDGDDDDDALRVAIKDILG